jgi:hypothetical protein
MNDDFYFNDLVNKAVLLKATQENGKAVLSQPGKVF